MKTIPRWHQSIVTGLGVLGYLSCTLQWLWLGVLFLPQLLDSQAKDFLLPPSSELKSPFTFEFGGVNLLMTAAGIAVTLVVLIITVVILARLPLSIAKTGSKATKTTADAVLPLITHHKKLPAKKRRLLTVLVVKIVKLALVLLPMALLSVSFFIKTPLPDDLIFMVGSVLAIGSIVWFSLEYVAARWLNVPADHII